MVQSVLVVEHNPVVLDQLSTYVKESEFKVHCAEDIESAMSKLRSHRQSIVILDWDLPNDEAFEIVQQIRGNHRLRRMHIMVVSSSSNPILVEAAMSAGADDFFTMPIGSAELRARLVWAVSRSQALV